MKKADVLHSGAELRHALTKKRLNSNVLGNKCAVIFLHGFASTGDSMMDLASYANDEGMLPVLFNYNSYKGVDWAANLLRELTSTIWPENHKHGYALVGHSMGGLVALDFACSLPRSSLLKGIAMLGTPNGGVPNRRIFYDKSLLKEALLFLAHMKNLAESLSGSVTPGFRCPSTEQLAGKEPKFLEALWERSMRLETPILSISGGKQRLHFARNNPRNRTLNSVLQHVINGEPNDGLVCESSSNAAVALKLDTAKHRNDYLEYRDIDHLSLTANQMIIHIVTKWIVERLEHKR